MAFFQESNLEAWLQVLGSVVEEFQKLSFLKIEAAV
jgi:hypothetical protein